MADFDYMCDIQIRSGLSVREFVDLLPINRTTWYDWARAETTPDPLRFRLAVARAKKLEKLIAAGKLPVSRKVPKKDRLDAVIILLQDA